MLGRALLLLVAAAGIFSLGVLARPELSRLKRHLVPQREVQPDDVQVFDLHHYLARSSHFATLSRTRSVVFLGDSRIANAEWPELLESDKISDRGISGDTTSGILRRLPASVPTAGVLCVLQVGVNDLILGASVDQVVANYRRIVDYLLKEKSARLVMTSIILVSEEQQELNRAIGECNRQLAQLASAAGATWIDLGPSLAPQGALHSDLRADPVHLNGDGYLRLRDAIAPALVP